MPTLRNSKVAAAAAAATKDDANKKEESDSESSEDENWVSQLSPLSPKPEGLDWRTLEVRGIGVPAPTAKSS